MHPLTNHASAAGAQPTPFGLPPALLCFPLLLLQHAWRWPKTRRGRSTHAGQSCPCSTGDRATPPAAAPWALLRHGGDGKQAAAYQSRATARGENKEEESVLTGEKWLGEAAPVAAARGSRPVRHKAVQRRRVVSWEHAVDSGKGCSARWRHGARWSSARPGYGDSAVQRTGALGTEARRLRRRGVAAFGRRSTRRDEEEQRHGLAMAWQHSWGTASEGGGVGGDGFREKLRPGRR
jgi:hypothetical protein